MSYNHSFRLLNLLKTIAITIILKYFPFLYSLDLSSPFHSQNHFVIFFHKHFMAVYLLRENYRDIRYRIDHARVSWSLKWYSNSKNPRVVASRISDGPLLSLRTFPHDPYLQKPRNFLRLDRTDFSEEQENNHKSDSRKEEGITVIPLENADQRSFSQPSLRSKLILRLQQMSGKGGSEKDRVSIDFDKRDSLQSCPVLPIRPASEGFQVPVTRSSAIQGAWKSILSGVSVSAARVSTGHSAPTSRDFEVLSGDFIQAELRKEKDEQLRDGPRYIDVHCLLDLLFMDEDEDEDESICSQHQILELYI